MPELYSIFIALLLAIIGGEIARKLHYPRVIGQLVISLFCAAPFLRDSLTDPASQQLMKTMSEIGIILLLFLTGFDLDLSQLKSSGKEAIVIAVTAAVFPFLIGAGLGLLLGFSNVTAVILGACLSLTAEGTKVALLLELKKIRTRIGSIMLGAGICDDVFEILFLTIVLLFAQQQSAEHLWMFPVKIVFFLAAILLASRILPFFIHRLERNKDTTGLLSFMAVIALLFAIGSEFVGLSSILGAFIGGILVQRSFLTLKDKNGEDHMLQALAFAVVIPFFFVQIGLNFSFTAILQAPLLTTLIFLAALVGKLGGTLLAKPFTTLSWRQLSLIGWGMNSRGVMELVIAQIAFTVGLISQELYSAIVFMAVTTTVLFPFVMQHMLKKTPGIME